MPPPNRPGRPGPEQEKPIEELTPAEARLALAEARSDYATDEDYETILAARLEQAESASRAARARAAERIAALEAKVAE